MQDLEKILDDVSEGDLVKFHLAGERSEVVGYVWFKSQNEFRETCLYPISDTHYSSPVFNVASASLFLGMQNPFGIDKGLKGEIEDYNLEISLQIVGVDVANKTLGRAPVLGYEILEKYKR